MIKEQVRGAILSKASSFLGESESNTSSALGAALPAILGSVINKGSSPSGASDLFDMIQNDGHDGGIFDSIGDMFGSANQMSGMLNQGSGLLSMLLGDKLGGVLDLITSFSGIKKGSSSSLMNLLAPMVMGMIGKTVKNQGLNAGSLLDFLVGQKKHVAAAAPAGMNDLLGFADFGDGLGDAMDIISETVDSAKEEISEAAAEVGNELEEDQGGYGKFLPWIIGLLAVLALVYMLRGCGGAVGDAADSVTSAADAATETVAEAAEGAASAASDVASGAADIAGNIAEGAVNLTADAINALAEAAKSTLNGIEWVSGEIGEGVSKFLAAGNMEVGKRFTFNELTFGSGSASISEATEREVERLATVLQAYPNVTIKVDGHTDNTGDAAANKTLSLNRAEAVRAYLASQSVHPDRVATEGFGSERPIASNDTEEGRTKNRRIEVTISGYNFGK
jgi:outer membrane protein OmpA-like peptidoglycan-associated protein